MDVLLVDDDAQMRLSIRRALRQIGFESADIAEAGDGNEALQRLEDASQGGRTMRLIVTDCQMPNMDGIRLTRALRAAGVSVPILMLSGVDDRAVINAALTAGVSNFLHKPVTLDLLRDALHQLLGDLPAAAA
jgi:CheY-like chemotaxis protein